MGSAKKKKFIPPPEGCKLPQDRLEELQCYKLLQAVRAEDFHLITELVTEGVPNLLNICEPTYGTFPLLLAVELRKIKVINKLFSLGCNANICNINGKTASMEAARCGFPDVLDLLIENKCNLAQQDVNQWDTLSWCLVEHTEHHLECLDRCLDEDPAIFENSIAIILALEKGEEGLSASKEILEKLPNPNIVHSINKRSALSYAAEFNPSLVVELLKKGADPHSKDAKSWTAVHFAAKSGAPAALEALSAFKADFNSINSDGQTAFHVACANGKSKVVKFIVQRGANPKIKDKKSCTGKQLASKKSMKEVRKAEKAWSKRPEDNRVIFKDWLHAFELEIETYVNMTEIDRDLLIQILTEQLKPNVSGDELVEFITLISKGSPELKLKDLWKPGRLVSKLYETPGNKKKKKKGKGKKKGKKGKKGKASKGNLKICVDPPEMKRRFDGGPPHSLVERLRLQTDLTRFSRDDRPAHPFQDDSAWYLRFPTRDFERVATTIKQNDMTSFKFALENGYPVDTPDRFFKTALMHAAAAGNLETVKFLISKGANIHATDNMRWTALHHAVSSGGFEVTKALVEAGADVLARTFNKATVLMRAAQGSDAQTIQYLLDNGAGGKKIFLENSKGQTVMDVAEKWADISSFRALREHHDKVPKPKEKRGAAKKKPKKEKKEKKAPEPEKVAVEPTEIKLQSPLGGSDIKGTLSARQPLFRATEESQRILLLMNQQWTSAPYTAQILQRQREIKRTPQLVQNVHRIWARNAILPNSTTTTLPAL